MPQQDAAVAAAPLGPASTQVQGDGARRTGRTWRFADCWITGAAAIAGPTEGQGPLGGLFDEVLADHLLGCRSWEQAESRMFHRAFQRLCRDTGLETGDFDLLLGGDLLNQTVASAFAARDCDLPFCGLYNACATFGEALGLAAALCEGGFCRRVAVVTSSHHDAAERQYRFPTELGNQRPPTAQWTATGAAAVAVEREAGARAVARVVAFTPGRVLDYGVKDPFNMGAAMAPAAADTLAVHLADLGWQPGDFGAIYTGDLGEVGVPLCEDLLAARGLAAHLEDCGRTLYDPGRQDVHAGGSGCACSALVFTAKILRELREGRLRRVCLCPTGSLHSTTTYQQGESIPAIAHAVTCEAVAPP
jgi:stage V sporulation protein AD